MPGVIRAHLSGQAHPSGPQPMRYGMEFTDLTLAIEDNLAIVTLNRPEARNAYTLEMIDSIVRVLDALEQNDDVRCVILTGAGTAFSAGGDLKAMKEHTGMFAGDQVRLRSAYMRGIQRIPRRFARFEKPIIAAINGPAVGAGLDLACMHDIRIAADGARFGSSLWLGLIPGDGGAYLLARIVGFPRALDLILTGRTIDTEAERYGLINEIAVDVGMPTSPRSAPPRSQQTRRCRAHGQERDVPVLGHDARPRAQPGGDLPGHRAEHPRSRRGRAGAARPPQAELQGLRARTRTPPGTRHAAGGAQRNAPQRALQGAPGGWRGCLGGKVPLERL